MSWDVIIPFLKPIEGLLRDPDITDILVNGGGAVFAEKDGRLDVVPGITLAEKSLQVAVRHIARTLGEDINEEMPILDARLPDGSRVAAIFPPCSVNGTTLAIRKFQNKRYGLEELARVGTLTPEIVAVLEEAIRTRANVLISGRTGAGKTTVLNAMTARIPERERIVVIEDITELQVDKPDLVRLQVRREQTGLAPVTTRDLLKASLRLRPDRILIGEIRGAEALDLLQALNTGHRGTLSTTHANCAAESLERFALCVLMADVNLPHRTLCKQIAFGLQLLVHLDVLDGRRRVTEVARVKGYDADRDRYDLETLYAA